LMYSRHLSRRFPRPPPFFLSFTHTRVFSTWPKTDGQKIAIYRDSSAPRRA